VTTPLKLPTDLGIRAYEGTQPSFISPRADDQLHQSHHLTRTQLKQADDRQTDGSTQQAANSSSSTILFGPTKSLVIET